MDPSYSFHTYIPFRRIREDLGGITALSLQPEIRISAEDLDGLRMKDVENLAREMGDSVATTLHAPYRDLSPGAFDRKIRAGTRERLEELLEVAGELRARSVVCHLGFDPRQHRKQADAWVDHSLETWLALGRVAEAAGTRIFLENVYEDSPALHERLLAQLPEAVFGVCFDVGHCNVYSQDSARVWFEKIGSRIHELHIHDNDGTDDQHRSLGQGKIDFNRLLKDDLPLLNRPMLTLEVMERQAVEESLKIVKTALGLA